MLHESLLRSKSEKFLVKFQSEPRDDNAFPIKELIFPHVEATTNDGSGPLQAIQFTTNSLEADGNLIDMLTGFL